MNFSTVKIQTMKIEGKVAWITGASSGIGAALATALFDRGATVILSARSAVKLEEIKVRFDEKVPGRCLVIPCDVTNKSSVQEAIDQVKHLAGRVDILINNAGVSQRSYALNTSLEVDRELFEVNFFGAVAVTKGIAPLMVTQGSGHIVVISSMAGKYGFRMRSSYSASKHALQGYFETLRAELYRDNIQVTIVCPGRIKTDISVHSLMGDGQTYGKMDKGQAQGVPVEKCAKIIVRAIEHNRKEIFIGKRELLLLIIKRVCPPMFYKIVNQASPT
jgi:dehydrogenase/reductase SDR family protein 7B